MQTDYFRPGKCHLVFVPECLFRHFPGTSSTRYTLNQAHQEMIWNHFCSGRIVLLSNWHNKTIRRLNGLLSLHSACQAQGWVRLSPGAACALVLVTSNTASTPQNTLQAADSCASIITSFLSIKCSPEASHAYLSLAWQSESCSCQSCIYFNNIPQEVSFFFPPPKLLQSH